MAPELPMQLNERVYEKLMREIGYAKLFPLILEDFVTRADLSMALMQTNMIVSGTAGQLPVTGVVNCPFKADTPSPKSIALRAKYTAKQNGGNVAEKVVEVV